jgi:preprotein translocase subunit SecF
MNEEMHQQIISRLSEQGAVEKRFDSVGPVLGRELRTRSITAILIALALISVYLTVVFRTLGAVLSPWVLGFAALVALIHDLSIPVGVFALLGKLGGVEIDPSLIAAALTIIGYSVNDTVVVFDRIRENYLRFRGDFNTIVHKSVLQTLTRSINTTLTTVFAVVAIYMFGGETLKNFSLALIIGISLGAYSSIGIASPILMFLHRKRR